MNIAAKSINENSFGIDVVEDKESLGMFLQTDCPGLIWHRETPPHVQAWLDRLDPDVFPTERAILRPDAVMQSVQHLSDISGLPESPERDWFIANTGQLAEDFASVISAQYLRLRLAVVKNNACRKFHIDAIHSRLICTYRGTGTQYGFAFRAETDPSATFTVPTGSPILLRGARWPEQPPSGLLHRSPPIEGKKEIRFVLVLDPVHDQEDWV